MMKRNTIEVSELALASDYLWAERDQWLLIDLDDVLADFAEYICDLMNRHGSQCTKDDYKSYEFSHFHGLEHQDMCSLIHTEQVYSNLKPKEGVIEALSRLADIGIKVAIVTSRGAFEGAHRQTEAWLDEHGAKYKQLKVVNPTIEQKSDYYLSLGVENIIGLVDDAEHNLRDAENVGIRSIKINQPWNTEHRADIHSDSLKELVDVLAIK